MRQFIHIAQLIAAILALWSCHRQNLVPDNNQGQNDGKGIGQMVLFSVGETENETKAANTYYMPDAYRFVCRMYYKAQTGSEDFDVEGGTDQTVWMKVSGNVGNSLYWNKDYNTPSRYDDYDNDYYANALYWQNRKEHAFLAWTDLNKAKTIIGGTARGTLKMEKDVTIQEHTGNKAKQYVQTGYKMVGYNSVLKPSYKEMLDYALVNYAHVSANESQREVISSMPEVSDYSTLRTTGYNNIRYNFIIGGRQRHDEEKDAEDHTIKFNYGPYVFYVWGENQRLEYIFEDGDAVYPDDEDRYWVRNSQESIVAQRGLAYLAPEGYEPKGEPYDYTEEDKVWKYHFWAVDRYLNFVYDLTQTPAFSVALYEYWEEQESEIIYEYDALAFDLTRGSRTSMSEQPDIAQALEIKAPEGATQESNRVNLYFKHKFSQIQVNVKGSGDESVALTASQIKKVELLGVSEEGYIFSDLDKDGKVKDASYKEIDYSHYTEQQLKDNPYGTAFGMFVLPEADTEIGYLKSFNAIAFGQLQAIRITWTENNASEKEHASTFRIPNTELVNLKSGIRYIWNIEIRRGTLAIIRTEIIDWELPDDEEHNGSVDGTISD